MKVTFQPNFCCFSSHISVHSKYLLQFWKENVSNGCAICCYNGEVTIRKTILLFKASIFTLAMVSMWFRYASLSLQLDKVHQLAKDGTRHVDKQHMRQPLSARNWACLHHLHRNKSEIHRPSLLIMQSHSFHMGSFGSLYIIVIWLFEQGKQQTCMYVSLCVCMYFRACVPHSTISHAHSLRVFVFEQWLNAILN